MDDVIYRQAAIDNVLDLHADHRVSWVDAVIDALETLPSAPQWIPVEVRPPKFGEDVLISYRNGVCVDWLTQSEGNAYFFISGVAIQDIDAWMPLPKPPKEGDE